MVKVLVVGGEEVSKIVSSIEGFGGVFLRVFFLFVVLFFLFV